MAEKKTVFNELFAINVNDKTEKKGTLTYLSWSFAWAEVVKRFPDVSYEIESFNGLPYIHDPETGYMVFTNVTIDGVTRRMWLPVMDARNKALLTATMTDINKTIMRCLTKNLAMFGLGLYIYAGEDLPEEEKTAEAKAAVEPIDDAKRGALIALLEKKGKTMTLPEIITFKQWNATMRQLEALPDADPIETKTE
jgi:hypothetical protein